MGRITRLVLSARCFATLLVLLAPRVARGQEPGASDPAMLPEASASFGDVLEPALPQVMQAPFTLVLNTVEIGEIVIALKDGDVFVQHADLEAAGIRPLEGRDEELLGQSWLSLKSVAPPLSYELDEHEIALRITAPVELLPETTLDLNSAPADVVYQTKTSGFVNYSARWTDRDTVDAYQEAGASLDGNLMFSSMYLSTLRGAVRGLSNFTLNRREARRRMVFGDSFVVTGPLGSGEFVGGLTISRSYELDPYLVRSPRIGFSGSTLTPATLDVYVNGALMRSEPIAPGRFSLNNLRVAGGKGTATYVLRDVFGKEQQISIPFYVSGSVLAKGLDEFNYSFGATRASVGTESWDYQRMAFLGTHRYGITNYLTLGGRAEGAERLVSSGPAITVLTPIGQIEAEIAGSYEQDVGPGVASFFSYAFMSRFFSSGFYGRVVSDDYATVSTPARFDRITREAGFFTSLPVLDRVTASVQGQLQHFRDRGTSWNAGGSVGARLVSHMMGLLYAGRARYENGSRSWEIYANLSYVFARRHVVSGGLRVSNGQPTYTLDATKSLAVGPGYGYRVSGSASESSHASALGQYQTTFGRYGAGYNVYSSPTGTEQHFTLETSGALAVVPGVGLFATVPITDSFGVIRVKGVKNVRGYINNQEIGRTDRKGNLVVPYLLGYYGNRLGIAPEDVPIRYTLDVTELTIAPPQRGVAVAEITVATPHFYRGRLVVDEHAQRVIPRWGQVRVASKNGDIISPLGEAGEFELENVVPGKHQAFIDYAGGTCAFELAATDSESTVIELGELTCQVPLSPTAAEPM